MTRTFGRSCGTSCSGVPVASTVPRTPSFSQGGTAFFSPLLHFPPYLLRPARIEMRRLWLEAALRETEGADLVCVDPDNGIGNPDLMYRKAGPKHVYMSDLAALWDAGRGLVVYHHMGMVKGGAERVMIPAAAAQIRDGLDVEPISLWFHRGTARAFYVVPQPERRDLIEDRVRRMLAGPWGQNGHFERVG